MIQFNEKFNNEILQVLKICKCNYRKYLKSGETKQHKDLKYLHTYIMKRTEMLSSDVKFSIRVFWVLNKWQTWPKCETCGKEIILLKTNKSFRLKIENGKLVYNWPHHCCRKCAGLDEKTKQKQIETSRKKYGCDNPFQNESIKEKCRQKHLAKYGVDVPFKSTEIRQRYVNTMRQKYGCENSFQLQKTKDAANSSNAKEKRNQSLSAYNMQKFGVPWFVMSDQFKQKTETTNGTSNEEKELVEFIKTYFNENIVVGSFKIIPPKQLDIYIPSLKLAFEFNGTYFHSYENTKDINYHLNKTKLCEEKNIKLVHIWEDEWIYEKEKTKKLIEDIISGNIVFPNDDIFELDRSKFNKSWKFPNYEIIDESTPQLVLRNKKNKNKYLVPDCGKLKFKKTKKF